MAREIKRLSARTVTSISDPGRHSDGGGLYLVVDKTGAKRWVFLFRQQGRLREMGLGGVLSVSLARARELAQEARTAVADGKDPIKERSRERSKPTFGEIAEEVVDSLKSEWRNDKHIAQWRMTLREYAKPLSQMRVDVIQTEDVLKVLRPIWNTKPETASRLRGRIERVLDAAKAMGHRTGENPALWRGHLKTLLPARQKLSRGHHAAMPYAEVPAFTECLRQSNSISALALEFTILTAARTGEALGATWREFDLADGVWTVPADRMKAGRPHRVPLSQRAMQILKSALEARSTKDPAEHVFPGLKPGRPLSNMSMKMLLRRMDHGDLTVHGFRSSFRDWAGEKTAYPREVAEAALAHVVGDASERAYRRGDALEKRRSLMVAWSSYLDTGSTANKVVMMVR